MLVDGVAVTTLWAPPYACDLTDQLHEKARATLRLEVSNTTANALAADDTVAGWVAEAERWHGRRFRMQALERVREGLIRPADRARAGVLRRRSTLSGSTPR